MTAPTITYGHGFFTDCSSTTSWSETESGLTSALTSDGDVFEIEGTCDNVADEYAYYRYDMTNISSDTYTKYLVRYKTSEASNGLAAKVVLNFTAGTQTIVLNGYSTDWTVASGDITAGKTIDSIDIYADDYPNTIDSGTYQVYYDYILLCKGVFTFPNSFDVDGWKGHNRYAVLSIPGRSGDVIQFLGGESETFVLEGKMENWGTWGSGSGASQSFGEYLQDIYRNADSEPWQWFTCDHGDGKVVMENYETSRTTDPSTLLFRLGFRLYSLSDYDDGVGQV